MRIRQGAFGNGKNIFKGRNKRSGVNDSIMINGKSVSWSDKSNLIPDYGKTDIIDEDKDEGGKVYTEDLCKNPCVKYELYRRQDGVCPGCGMGLDPKSGSVIHHINYDKKCLCPDNKISIYKPTKNKPYAKSKIIDCGSCDENVRKECHKDLRLIHNRCNKEINDIQLEIKKSGKSKKDYFKSGKIF